jgi:5'-3' exonuclease
MLSTMRYYDIVPVFIFDGKPPPEKKGLLLKRKEDKQEAENEYNKLKKQLENKLIDDVEKQEVVTSMDILKKKFVYISKNDIEDVKNLIRAYGATYYDAPGEADELCALLVIKNKVWACLSEDMDMFVYGCSRVIRYLSLLNRTVVLYDTSDILNNLGITQKELREICVISGTDYNYNDNNNNDNDDDNCKNTPSLYKTLGYFKKYHKANSELDFYDWLKEKTDYIRDYDKLLNIYNLFELNNEHTHLTIFENIKIVNGPIMREDIKNIIKSEGFIFPEL